MVLLRKKIQPLSLTLVMSLSPKCKKVRSDQDISSLGVLFPRILIPKESVDLKKWAVVACDQYTSEEDYWERVEAFVGTSASTLRLTFPEIFLDKNKDEAIISGIAASMESYLVSGDVFRQTEPGVVLVERTLRGGTLRRGIVLALDLEKYDYTEGSTSLIRATEKTIIARIPPRLAVRRKVPMEFPHIIVLIDDPTDSVLTDLWHFATPETQVYETELMENSGHLRGFSLTDPKQLETLKSNLLNLADPEEFKKKYPEIDDVLLFAMGDGNHSLATAKAHWEEVKKTHKDHENHPARFALVELQNCQDPTLVFEPIHRLLFGGVSNIFADMKEFFKCTIVEGSDAFEAATSEENTAVSFGYVFRGKRGSVTVEEPKKILPVAEATDFLDQWLEKNKKCKIDYVHEMTAIDRFCTEKNEDNIAFVFSTIAKSDLFKTVIYDGALPRKTFSMGAAHDKRFYFEGRHITPEM